MDDSPVPPEDSPPPGFVRATHGGPYAADLGPFWVERGERLVRLGLRVRRRHCNSAGAAHGGMVASLADLGLIHAVSVLRERQGQERVPLSTVSMSIDYLGPAPEGSWLEIASEVTRLGGSLAFVEGSMTAEGRRVARASGVFSIRVPRRLAAG